MALDVYLQKDNSLPEICENRFLSFEDDGYFWFLYPFFESISKQTNQKIDRCEDAFFKGKDLDLFDKMIEQAKEVIIQKPDIWQEFIGTVVHKGERKVEKIYSTVHKKELESMLIKLEKATIKAKKNEIGIFFFGD